MLSFGKIEKIVDKRLRPNLFMFNENKLNIFVKIEADIRNQAKAKVKQA